MRLYLSSYFIGDHSDALVDMVGANRRMAIITNALDAIPLEDQIAFAQKRFDAVEYFTGYGFDPSLIDLRHYFGREIALRALLSNYGVVWAVGGNCFLLRKAMRLSGFDAVIRDLLAHDQIVYSGWSAGACVAGVSLQGIDLMDDPEQAAPAYPDCDLVWEGLQLVPYVVVPHHESDHPEAPLASKASIWLDARKIDYMPLRDGEVLVQVDNHIEKLPRKT
jgi:dipeptidase E